MTPTILLMALAQLASTALPADGTQGARRFALVVAESSGGGDRLTLRYAAADARAVSHVLTELGGIAADDALLVVEPGLAGLTAALRQMAQALGAAKAGGERTELIFYYSGHSDESGLLLGGERLSYVDLRRAVEAMAADLRVVVLDSCASGELTRTKGVVRRPAFLSEVGRAQGHAFLTSSSANESAQESDAIGASFFTHFLVAGLRGAADVTADGRVSLTEAYQFAFHETLARTERTTLGGQHPAYAMNIVGTGDVVLTDLTRAEALLVMPEESGGRFFVRDTEHRLVVELQKVPGRATELALPAGTYTVLVDRPAGRFAGSVELLAGDRVVVEETALTSVGREPVIARGPSPAELAARAAERDRVARRVYEREKLRVEKPGALFDPAPFNAFAGDVAVPLGIADFFDRAGRPDLVTLYDENISAKAWTTYGGLGVDLLAVGAGLGLMAAIAFIPLPAAVVVGVLGGAAVAMVVGLVGGVVGIVGSLRDPVPIGLPEAQALAREHNLRLQRQLGIEAGSR